MSNLDSWEFLSAQDSETKTLGRCLGVVLCPGIFVALNGPLGSGKTTFCGGLGIGLDIPEPLASPTYLLCREYQGRHPVLHFDAYFQPRLESLLLEGMAERFDGDHVVLMEWAELVADWLPEDRVEIGFSHGEDENQRLLTLVATGKESSRILNLAFGPPVSKVSHD